MCHVLLLIACRPINLLCLTCQMQIKVSIPFPLTTTYHCLSFLFSHFLSLNTDKNNWPPTHVLWSYQYMETKKKRGGGGEETRELIKWPDVPLLEGKILDIPECAHTQIPTHTYMLVSMSRGWQVDFHNDWSRWCSVIYLSCWTGNPSVSVMFLAAPAFLSLVRSLTGLFFFMFILGFVNIQNTVYTWSWCCFCRHVGM